MQIDRNARVFVAGHRGPVGSGVVDGTPRTLLGVSRLRVLGWSPMYHLDTGIRSTCEWFVAEQSAHDEMCGMPGLIGAR